MAIAAVPQSTNGVLAKRESFARISEVLPIPNLIDVQTRSFQWFMDEGLKELFAEISPITDFTGKNLELHFLDYTFGPPKYSEWECRERDMTYSVPLRVRTRLVAKETGEIKEQEIFMGDFPKMTDTGTFIINGAERVVVSQLVRSPGVYFTLETDPTTGRQLCYGKLIPNRGAWLEFETSNRDVMSVKVDRKRKIPVTTLLRAIGYATDEQILSLFTEVDTGDHRFVSETVAKDPAKGTDDALLEFYRRLRPGDPPTVENARNLINALFFNFRRYDLGKVGRYKVNRRLGLEIPEVQRILTKEDLVKIVEMMVKLNNGVGHPDDIDHLGNRRVRAVGELIQNAFRVGLLRMERVVKERMSIQDADQATPNTLINIRPVVAAMKEFFGGSQLSQFMDQTNPLSELTHKRRLSALGPGGLSRDRAGFDVRDVHPSHYGRICPIETPEGPNIGLIGSLATYGKINQYGFIETPYRRVISQLVVDDPALPLESQILRDDAVNPESGKVVLTAGTILGDGEVKKIQKAGIKTIRVKPVASEIIDYLSADREEQVMIAQANTPLDERGRLIPDQVVVRVGGGHRFPVVPSEQVAYMDVSPKQVVSVATSLIPFLEHDDANRALMGANMQRQAVPLLQPRAPIIGTGVEFQAAKDSGQVQVSRHNGVATAVTARIVKIRDDDGAEHTYNLQKFVRSNQDTCINQ